MNRNGTVKIFTPDEIVYWCIERREVPHKKIWGQASDEAQTILSAFADIVNKERRNKNEVKI